MKKKILIGLGVVVLLIIVAFFYLNNRNRTLSPPGETSVSANGMEVSVTYSRPSVRDRLIFGDAADGALQPNGVYWRLGANEPTFMEVSSDFNFGGTEIEAGKYVIYAIPEDGGMELRLSSDLRMWGYTEPDYSKDMASTSVSLQSASLTEQFTIEAVPDSQGAKLIFSWSDYQWELTLEKQ